MSGNHANAVNVDANDEALFCLVLVLVAASEPGTGNSSRTRIDDRICRCVF